MSYSPEDVRTGKALLRKQVLQQRSAMPAAERVAAAAAVAERVGTLIAGLQGRLVVSGFLAIGEEIDPQPALDRVMQLGHRLCLPVMIGRGQRLTFRAWQPGDAMLTRQWGIREPAETADVVEPDVLLVPLLACDEGGGRLGYGGGYFDRTLAALRLRGPVLAVGIAYDVQMVDSVPRLDYDEPLDWILTPSRAVSCRRAG